MLGSAGRPICEARVYRKMSVKQPCRLPRSPGQQPDHGCNGSGIGRRRVNAFHQSSLPSVPSADGAQQNQRAFAQACEQMPSFPGQSTQCHRKVKGKARGAYLPGPRYVPKSSESQRGGGPKQTRLPRGQSRAQPRFLPFPLRSWGRHRRRSDRFRPPVHWPQTLPGYGASDLGG